MRQLVLLTLTLWLLTSLMLGLLFNATPYQELAAALSQPNFAAEYETGPLVLTPERYRALQLGLLAVAAISGASLVALRRPKRQRRTALVRLQLECRQALTSLRQPWQRLDNVPRTVALALGGAALLVRGWMVLDYPITTDELTSYDYYVRPGLAITASNYSLPNNHILYNLLVGSLPAHLPPDLLQRLPAILIGLLLLPISYLVLLRYLRFTVATLAMGLFTFAPMPAFYSIAGRGYGLQLAAVVAGFFATLALLRPGGLRRLPWLVFVVSGVVGLYAVPTHVYTLAALGLALLVGFGQQTSRRRGPNLARLVLATASIGTTTALLYAPVGAVSGWPMLLHNSYVQSLSWPEFWRGFYDPYLLSMASQLWGQGRGSLLLLGSLALVGAVALRRVPQPLRRLGWLSYALVFLPLLLLLAQRVYVPARALLPSALFSFVLLALLLQEGIKYWQSKRNAQRMPGWSYLLVVVLVTAAYGTYRLRREATGMRAIAAQHGHLRRQHAWLRAQRPTRVWLDSLSRPYQGIYWYHVGVLNHGRLPLAVARRLPALATGSRREYAVFYRAGGTAPPPLLQAQQPAYVDDYIQVWRLPFLAKIQ